MMAGFLETIADGGCYWRRKDDGIGHSFAVENGTPFKIALEGPQSHRFHEGLCHDGYFVTADGAKHLSANEAVNKIRDVSSNAFLHLHFRINGKWVLADTIRESSWSVIDEVEEEALQIAKEIVRSVVAMRKTVADEVRITKVAAAHALKTPAITEMALANIERRKALADIELDFPI